MIKKHVPKPARTGRPREDDRKITNGIIYVLVSGCRWSEMPQKYGDDSTANRKLSSWQQNGVWKKILKCAIKTARKQNRINMQKISVDSPTVPSKKGATLLVLTDSRGL